MTIALIVFTIYIIGAAITMATIKAIDEIKDEIFYYDMMISYTVLWPVTVPLTAVAGLGFLIFKACEVFANKISEKLVWVYKEITSPRGNVK